MHTKDFEPGSKGSFLDISRRYSIAHKLKKEARKVQKCVFEVGRHSVKEVIEKIIEEIERSDFNKGTDLGELMTLIDKLATVILSSFIQFYLQ